MATVLDLVKHYQHAIEKYPNDEQKVLKSIDKLFNLDVTVQHLQETGVGRTVNALRKESGDVGHAARALVYKWKLMVAAEESDQDGDHNTDTTTYNGHENGKDSDDNAKQQHSSNKYDHYEKPNANMKTDQKELNGNSSGGKKRHHSSEDEEPDVKKSRSSGNTHHHHGDHKSKHTVQVKKEPMSEDESDDSDRSQSEDSDSDASESSREEEERKIKREIKQEPTENHKSTSSKHSSSQKSSRSPDHKRESSSSKRSHESEKHSKRHHSSEPIDRHSSEKSSTKDKSHSSDKHKSSNEKYKNSKSESSSSEKDKKQKEDSKSSKHKHSSDKQKSSNSDNSSEKPKSQNEKHSSKSEKHKSSSHSQKSNKEKHKSTSENSDEKHKSKHSSSSKEKHRSSSKDQSKDRSSSSKDKTEGSKENHHSHKSEKKQTSSSESRSKHSDSKHKSDKHDERSNETKSKHKSSSSSSHKSKSSSSKSKEEVPKKRNETNSSADSDDGIDCGSGASFAEALGMVSPAKPKKKTAHTKEFAMSGSMNKDLSPASLLAPTAKLAPLPLPLSLPLEISALPDISPNYKPRPPPKLMPHFTEEEALSSVISSKNQRTKVYSGNKVIGKIPSLYEMCVQILQEHIDALEYTGGVPYDILKPVVDRATPQQLFLLEHYNPYLMEDTDHLWEKFCLKNFRNKQRKEMETWREMYMRCQEEQEHRLKSLTANIKMTQEAKKAPIKQTKMAYVDSVVKPPRNIARKQALHGTAHAASASPAARVASLAAAPNVLRGNTRPTPTAAVSASSFKPKKAPLMQKALQFMRGRKR